MPYDPGGGGRITPAPAPAPSPYTFTTLPRRTSRRPATTTRSTTSRRSGGGGGGGAIGGGGAPALSADAADTAKSLYGYLGWFVDHPEVGPIILQAAAEGWDKARLEGALSKTYWWQTTSESMRQWDALWVMDRATANRRVEETYRSINAQVQQLGAIMGSDRILNMTHNALRYGWNESEIKIAIASEMRWRPGEQTGAVADMMSDVRAVASKYLIPVSERQAWEWVRRMVGGGADMDAVEGQMRTLAIGRFPHLQAQIEAGVAPGDYFAGHRNTLSQLLEISPEAIDFVNDARWNPVLATRDTADGPVRAMNLAETARFARSQDAWSHTSNGWQTVTEAGDAVLQTFGKVAR